MTERVRVRVRFHGRVQGVGFRYWTADTARAAGVGGWVRNLPGGDVEAELEGAPDVVRRLVEALRAGPPLAHVTEVHTQDLPPRDEQDFCIEH